MSTQTDTILDAITCPITHQPMTDPVSGNDGYVYERLAILEALSIKNESPMTRQPMTKNDIKVNPSIRFLCDKYHSGEFGPLTTNRKSVEVSNNNIKLLVQESISNKFENSTHFMLEFKVDEDTFPKDLEFGHLSQDIVLVIDRSGSMNAAVEAKDTNGKQLENGFSVQDIVNHAAKTVVKTLDKNSRISIVAFDNIIEVPYALNFMSEINKGQALAAISTIKPRGQTNLWGALEKAICILDERENKSRNSAIMLFTDGIPNISPARGEVETLKKLRKNKNFTAPIYTFGFGYNLLPNLLYDIAKNANGANGHIPDGTMIATVFCNFISTILSTVVNNLQLHIINPPENIDVLGDYVINHKLENENNLLTIDLGTVQYQQARNIVLKFENNTNIHDTDLKYYFTYKIGGASKKSESTVKNKNNDNNILCHINRYHLTDSIRKMINHNTCHEYSDAIDVFTKIKQKLENSQLRDELSCGMLNNLRGNGIKEGQIELAVKNIQHFERWGKFYLDQLSLALNLQIKPNFKDEACVFGGDVFDNIVDRASDIFDTLTPPEPSLIEKTSQSFTTNYLQPSSQPSSMSRFNDPNGGCFIGSSLIQLADGSFKSIVSLKKGDEVFTLSDPLFLKTGQCQTAKVIALVQINCSNLSKDICNVNGLKVTPWHPIVYNNIWVFPSSICEPIRVNCNAVYNVVLSNGHTLNVNGVWAITLGHEYNVGILEHEYFGSKNIIKDLMKKPGWNDGHVVINDNDFITDFIDQTIIGMKNYDYNVIYSSI